MSREYVILSKKVRPRFKAKLIFDDSPQSPREWGEPTTSIHLWGDRHSDLPTSQDIRSYEDAIYELYKKVYPELIDRCLDDEPPPEVLELIDRTEYPGVALWLTPPRRLRDPPRGLPPRGHLRPEHGRRRLHGG